jgi:hypothetical protein
MKTIIDRIDEGIAVLISQEDETVQVNVPVSILPEGSIEGNIITLTFERDAEATRQATERVQGLIDRLKKY